MKQINWDVSLKDAGTISKIVKRAWPHVKSVYKSTLDLNMDITATHANGNPLRLQDLLESDDFNFSHDIIGIARHLDRRTGKLIGFFVPRFSKPISNREKTSYKEAINRRAAHGLEPH